MNTFKKFALATAGTTLTIEQTMAAIAVGTPDTKLVGTNSTDLVTNVQNILSWLLGLLALLATAYWLYGGFLMVTAGGDEEKVKKGKNILIQVALGIVVIFLAYSIVNWVVGFMASK